MSQDGLSLALTVINRSISTVTAGWSMEQSKPCVRTNVLRSKSMQLNGTKKYTMQNGRWVKKIKDLDLKIDKNVEIPRQQGFWKSQAQRMDFGDSVEFTTKKEAESLRQALRQCKNTCSLMRYIGKSTWRVWKVERSSSDT